jgi:hypothetical protein
MFRIFGKADNRQCPIYAVQEESAVRQGTHHCCDAHALLAAFETRIDTGREQL